MMNNFDQLTLLRTSQEITDMFVAQTFFAICILSSLIFLSIKKCDAAYRMPLFLSVLFKLFLILGSVEFFVLPESFSDSYVFHKWAVEASSKGLDHIWELTGINSYFYANFLGVIFYFFGESLLIPQLMTLTTFSFLFVATTNLSTKITGTEKTLFLAWILAFYPSLTLYSVISLREVYFALFAVLAFKNVIIWTQNKSSTSFLLALIFFFLAGLFHSVGIVLMLALLAYVLFIYLKRTRYISFLILIICLYYFLPDFLSSSKYLRVVYEIFDVARYNGSASYPEFLQAKDWLDFLLKIPLKIIYFVGSPFIWDISKPSHLFGLIDGTFFLLLNLFVFKNFIANNLDTNLKTSLLLYFVFILVMSIFTANFGTALRHRVKILPLILLLFFSSFRSKKTIKK